MTYNVSSGTLNPTHSLTHSVCVCVQIRCVRCSQILSTTSDPTCTCPSSQQVSTLCFWVLFHHCVCIFDCHTLYWIHYPVCKAAIVFGCVHPYGCVSIQWLKSIAGAVGLRCLENAHFVRRAILTSKVCQTDLVFWHAIRVH